MSKLSLTIFLTGALRTLVNIFHKLIGIHVLYLLDISIYLELMSVNNKYTTFFIIVDIVYPESSTYK